MWVSYVQEAEDDFVKVISDTFDDVGVTAKVALYHGESSSPEAVMELIQKAHHSPQVLVAFANKQAQQGSTSSRFRDEDVMLDVYVATKSHRSAEHSARIAYPIMDAIEYALVGRSGMQFKAQGVVEREAVRGGSVTRIIDQPDFSLFQMTFTVGIRRDLDQLQ